MYKFEKILVALDNTEIDNQLIEAASMVSAKAKSKEIFFMNVIRENNLPESVLKEFPDIMRNAVLEREKEIQLKIDQFFTNENVKIKIVIKSGQPTKSLLKYSAKRDIDLIIMGRKNAKPGGGTIVNRIARRAGCSLLILPNITELKFQKLLVPIDYSSHAREAMNYAIEFAMGEKSEVMIYAQKVYQVPSGYHTTGKTYTEFAKIMKENVEKEYVKFMTRVNQSEVPIVPIYSLDRNDDIIEAIFKTARTKKVDAIVIGAQGMTSTTALFLGSKAEKLIHMDSNIPLVVIRRKDDQVGILEYLKNI